MLSSLRASLRPLAVLVALGLPAAAQADVGSERTQSPRVARLLDAKQTLKWNLDRSGARYGHAEALVAAPAEKVAKTAADFGHYKELHRKFRTARVVGKEGDRTDVYMRYPVTIGMLTVELHEVMRFEPPRAAGDVHVLEGRGVTGDMKTGHTVIKVTPIDDRHSLLEVDVLLVPKLPAPQSFVDEELRDGAQDFVNGLKDRAQGWVGPVTSL